MAVKLHEVTKQALEEFQKEYTERSTLKREEIKQRLQEARLLGDLSENSDYDDARREQRINEERINFLKTVIDNHKIISEEYITVKFIETGLTRKFQIVGTLEADSKQDKISFDSPLGNAVFKRNVGDIVTYTGGNGKTISVEVVSKS